MEMPGPVLKTWSTGSLFIIQSIWNLRCNSLRGTRLHAGTVLAYSFLLSCPHSLSGCPTRTTVIRGSSTGHKSDLSIWRLYTEFLALN
jgi:hypothetical protein